MSEEIMENTRLVERIVTIFDLMDCGPLDPAGPSPIRVMLLYEREKHRKEFIIVDRSLSQDVKNRMSSWLEQNFDLDLVLLGAPTAA